MAGKLGVHPQQPENAALERELRCLYRTRTDSLPARRGIPGRAGQPLGR